MIIVSDTSPLNYLVLIGHIEVLPTVFRGVYVPERVMLELGHAKTPPLVKQWASNSPAWLEVRTPKKLVRPSIRLDAGELHALSLAEELGADALLIEKRGRKAAKERGYNTIGTITVLELAASMGLVDLEKSLRALQQTTFYLSEELLMDTLKRSAAKKK